MGYGSNGTDDTEKSRFQSGKSSKGKPAGKPKGKPPGKPGGKPKAK